MVSGKIDYNKQAADRAIKTIITQPTASVKIS
jgi:hypothetical protein